MLLAFFIVIAIVASNLIFAARFGDGAFLYFVANASVVVLFNIDAVDSGC